METKRIVKIEIPYEAASICGAHGACTLDDVIVRGRLLGAVSAIEATKIIQNVEVAQRISTKETVDLKDALDALEKINKDNVGRNSEGRLVVAIKSLERSDDSAPTEVHTRQIYITPLIDMVSETATGTKNDLMSAKLSCAHDELIELTEEFQDE